MKAGLPDQFTEYVILTRLELLNIAADAGLAARKYGVDDLHQIAIRLDEIRSQLLDISTRAQEEMLRRRVTA